MRIIGCILIVVGFAYHAAASGPEDSTKSSIAAKEILRLASLEKLFPSDGSRPSTTYSNPPFDIDWQNEEEFFVTRLEKLNNKTPFEFVYRDVVRSYIRLYAVSKNGTTARILGLSKLYFPLFEEQLAQYGLPDELKYLAVVESALHAKAKSHAAAVGLWQFIPSTGRMFDLKINSHIDERSDPVKATQAACKYLKSLYNIFGNWELALAAYNAGPGNVNRAIRKSGGKRTYWEIYDFLPRETRGYVPAFIAVNYIMNYHLDHGITPLTTDLKYCDFDTVTVSQNLNLEQISTLLNEPIEVLQFLNPSLKTNTIPAGHSSYSLCLPKEKINKFYLSRNNIPPLDFGNLAYDEDQPKVSTSHQVKKGETLSSISRKYKTTVQQLKSYNHLKTAHLQIGQTLVVNVQKAPAKKPGAKPSKKIEDAPLLVAKTEQKAVATQGEAKNAETSEPAPKSYTKFHVVQKGDTLWSIAQKYDGITVTDIQKLNNLNDVSLKPGQKLIISIGS